MEEKEMKLNKEKTKDANMIQGSFCRAPEPRSSFCRAPEPRNSF